MRPASCSILCWSGNFSQREPAGQPASLRETIGNHIHPVCQVGLLMDYANPETLGIVRPFEPFVVKKDISFVWNI